MMPAFIFIFLFNSLYLDQSLSLDFFYLILHFQDVSIKSLLSFLKSRLFLLDLCFMILLKAVNQLNLCFMIGLKRVVTLKLFLELFLVLLDQLFVALLKSLNLFGMRLFQS